MATKKPLSKKSKYKSNKQFDKSEFEGKYGSVSESVKNKNGESLRIDSDNEDQKHIESNCNDDDAVGIEDDDISHQVDDDDIPF